jgi:hypothetical protein
MDVPSRRPPRAHRAIRFELVRSNGRVRVLSHLDAADAAAFARGVGRIAPCIEGVLGPEVLANRVGALGRLEPWRHARARWRSEVDRRLGAGRPPSVLVADVRECYASIGDRAVAASLRAAGVPASDIEAILSLIARFHDEGVHGLPVGPEPSAVLANAVLAGADDALRAAGVAHLRWVDDFIVFAPDDGRARAGLEALHRSLTAVGLELNEAKTRLARDPLEARALLRVSGGSFATDSRMA